jgi:hypothetical protein
MLTSDAEKRALNAMSAAAQAFGQPLPHDCLVRMLKAVVEEISAPDHEPTGLTKRMVETVNFIRKYAAENDGVSPSYAEIQTALGLKSRSSVNRLIVAIERRGALKRGPGIGRNVILVKRPGSRRK